MASSSSDSTIPTTSFSPYGSWKSPITAEIVSGSDKKLSGFALDAHARLLWVESRPNESGKEVLVREGEKPGDEPIDVLPNGFQVRTTDQEYGGQAFAVSGNTVVFSNYQDQRLYQLFIGDSSAVPITPDYGGPLVRYADGMFDSRFNRYITIMEDHRQSSSNPTASIAAIQLNTENIQEPKVLVTGNDFYSFPRMDSNGERLAWVEWSNPNMHWDKAQLWVGYISENGDIHKRICIAGGDPTTVESPTEPKWSPKGELFFVTDRHNGFWNIYKWIEEKNEVVPVYILDAEFSRPIWVFGICSYDFIKNHKNNDSNLLACSYRQKGKSYIGILDDTHNSFSLLDVSFTDINNVISGPNFLYLEGASATHPLSIAKVTLDDGKLKVVGSSIIWSSSPDSTKYKSYFSLPEFIEFPTEFQGQKSAYANFYPPSNPHYQATQEERPPLLLRSHGGPTDESRGKLDLNIQYWTSRGWAFVDVNYGGSSGYGREFRDRLIGRWGIVDVNDCCNCAIFLVETGKVDGERLCITGESSGGYTTLASLVFRQTFKAGSSLYGIADLKSLKEEISKFEVHYIDNLVGNEDAYFERSPINFVENFSCPVILFQGLEDKIVAPDQAHKMHMALKQKGLPVALVEYEGEGHGFRKAENLKFTLEQQMMFFARLVGHFKVADDIRPIKIDNFD
ncbi:Dipeptidyl aminopeptidase biii [Thalictrum thalictroides]|uniref:Dipeptidyl aminopeptidase biii n=1 Tax=Thalictrum thalictroides TaxID=46969 RepID=A0A7J6WSZ5_THATH|nr:Dipeptidyl aminopeptidase biii [Thalictrum thalictroides]